MAQIHYRANLSAATFPMTVEKSGRNVIIPGPDQNFDRRIDAPGETSKGTVGIPQVIYMHNVLPTEEGYQSAGNDLVHIINPSALDLGGPGSFPPGQTITNFVKLDLDNNQSLPNSKLFIAFFSNNSYTVAFESQLATWPNIARTFPTPNSVSTPENSNFYYIRGVLYYFVKTTAQPSYYTFNAVTGFFDITATVYAGQGANSADLTTNFAWAISSYNYHIVASRSAIGWSSTTTPTDFSTSLVSGAGYEQINNLKGKIVFLKEHVDGFFIYTTENVLFAQYTGNQRYPWKFREVPQSGGYISPRQVAGDTNSGSNFGVDVAKNIQVVSPTNAESLFPDITDFLSRADFYSFYDSVTNTFTHNNVLDKTLNPSVWYVLDRYIIIAYTKNINGEWTNSFIYDTKLKRFGKLFLDWTFIFGYKNEIYFVQVTQRLITKLIFSSVLSNFTDYVPRSVIVLGKFQYVRSRFICIDELEIENIRYKTLPGPGVDKNFSAVILPTLDGKTFLPAVSPYDTTPTTVDIRIAKFLCHTSCQNFALAFSGYFDLNTVALTFHPEGDM
jgi:hypothetical protein